MSAASGAVRSDQQRLWDARERQWLEICKDDPALAPALLRGLCSARDEASVRRFLSLPASALVSPDEITRLAMGALETRELGLASALAGRPGVSEAALKLALTVGFLTAHEGLLSACAEGLALHGEQGAEWVEPALLSAREISAIEIRYDQEANDQARANAESGLALFERAWLSARSGSALPAAKRNWGL